MANEVEGMAKALQIPAKVLNDLDKVDEKINKIATDSEKMAKAFQFAMQRMGDGAGTLLQRLTEIQGVLKALGGTNISGINNVASGMKNAATEAEKTASAVSKAAEAMNKYRTSSSRENNTTDEDASRRAYIERYEMYKRMFDQIERNEQREIRSSQRVAQQIERDLKRQEAARARLDSRMRRSNYQDYVTSTEGSLRTAGRATNYNQRAQAISNLEAAMKRLNTADANYEKDLKRLSNAHKRLTEEQNKFMKNIGRVEQQQSSLMNHTQQLSRQLALLFSVSAIEGYVTKLIQVRGEFEKQNVALTTLLGNKDQADKLQGQITELAVQSPFSLRELTTYAKSLAAYQVQYEELYDTTKMLADVSSGLGVDMQRLILAFGQVKAANFLRGTETRQFTEAGINMLGELAKYYSELEGRIISVGEVQERQFRRMISFQDVEEVFKRLTSAGGMFYDMQERQAETLAGQWSNLTDSIDVMLNEIGIANEGVLKGMVSTVRDIIQNWQEVVYVMKPAVTALGAYLAITNLARIGTSRFAESLVRLTTGANRSTASLRLLSMTMTTLRNVARGLAASFTAILPVAIIAGIIELTRRLTQASREAQRFNEDIRNITKQGILRASELASGFERLANEAVSAADGSEKQKKALSELSRTYDGIIPKDDLKIERLREMKGAYDSVTTAIYNKIEADTRENLLQEVNNTYGTKAVEAMGNLVSRLKDFGISQDRAKTIVTEFRRQWDAGQISSSSALEKLQQIVQEYTGEVVKLTETGIIKTDAGKQFGQVQIEELTDFTDALTKFEYERNKIIGKPIEAFRVGGGTDVYKQLSAELENISKLQDKWNADNKNKFQLQIEFSEESKNKQIAEYEKFIQSIRDRITKGDFSGINESSALLVIEQAQQAIDKLNVNPIIDKVNELRLSISQLTGVDLGKLNFTEMVPTDGMDEYIKGIETMVAGYKEAIAVFDEAKKLDEEVPWFQRESLLQGMESEEELRKRASALEMYLNSLRLVGKEESGGGRNSKDPMLDRFKEIIKLIEEAKKRYDELNEEFDSEVATQMVRTQFSDTPAGDIIATMTFDAQGVVNGLNKAIQSTGKAAQEEYRKVFQDASRPFETKLLLEPQIEKREELEQQIEDMFDQYNLSIELTSTGVSGDAIKSLFDTDIIDLETLKSEILKLKPVFEAAGLNWQEVWERTEERLTEESNKQLQERLKSYAKYLKQTVSERARIEIEAQKKIADIQNIDTLSDTQKQGAISNIREEADKEKAKVIWEDFQNTDLYISMFEDLENVSTKTLEYMRQKLIEIRDTTKGLPVEDIKAINEQLDKMQEVTISRNPFQGIADNIREVVKARKEWNEVEDEYLARNEEKDFLEKSIANQEVLLSQARARYDAEVKTNGAFSVQAMSQKMTINLQEQSLSKDRERLKVIEEILKKLGLIKDNLQWSVMSLGQRFSQIGQWAGELSSAVPEIASSFENIFGNMGDKGSDIVSTVSEVLDGVSNMATGVGRFMSGDVIGGSIQALTGLVGTIGSLVQIGDKKKERQIQRELELVENLEKAYEKLEEAIDNAYSIDTLGKATEGAASNIKDQIDSYEEMIRLEQDKKKTDKDRIKEWEEQIEQLEEQLDEIYTENFNKVTGDILSDVLSAAENFTDAWLNAFLETGDGMQGLEDSFDDMITNMLKRQASMLITQQWIEQWKKQLEQYINPEKGDLELTTAEAKKWVSSVTSSLPQLNEALEAYFKAMEEAGVDLSGSNNGDNMSGLQRGIQSITEQTAEVLAALLESVRFFVSDENAVIHNIYNWLTTMPAETPLMQELRLQTQHLASMDSLLTSVIKSSSGKGKVMRVEIV